MSYLVGCPWGYWCMGWFATTCNSPWFWNCLSAFSLPLDFISCIGLHIWLKRYHPLLHKHLLICFFLTSSSLRKPENKAYENYKQIKSKWSPRNGPWAPWVKSTSFSLEPLWLCFLPILSGFLLCSCWLSCGRVYQRAGFQVGEVMIIKITSIYQRTD